ncbi:hypothetical protein HFP15_10210 [Amycolatopsis sp. K13G38]|uniref:PE-PGRS family protein n=1 Tax=Amycolatopsis acididurans TaxID=2724524 RepID=A0ABX1J0G2_9PSEU|nr:hypothetical protein [Amycolatopsis acididurans]NKQ53256.1 hypothetical protein [Amycolatopsis acididurans]
MQTWAKRGLQTALVTGGLLMLGTGIASADENVSPDTPAGPLDVNASVPVDISQNAIGTLGKQVNLPEVKKEISTKPVTGALNKALAPVSKTGAMKAAAPATSAVNGAVSKATAATSAATAKATNRTEQAPSVQSTGDPFMGNKVVGNVAVPIQITGNALGVLGNATVDSSSSQTYEHNSDVNTSGAHGGLAGNVVNLDWALPVQIAGNALGLGGSGHTTGSASQSATTSGETTTDGTNGGLAGNVVAPQGATPVQVSGNALGWFLGHADTKFDASSEANSGGSIATHGSKGAGTGNVAGVPVALPVKASNNAVSWGGDADSAGSATADSTAGGKRPGLNDIDSYIQTDGDGSFLAGNIAQPQPAAPVTVVGNAAAWIGNSVAGSGAERAANVIGSNATAGGFSSTSGQNAAGSGNIADAPVALPAEVFCVGGTWIGNAHAGGCENTVNAQAGDGTYTNGNGSFLGGNSVDAQPAGTAEVFGVGGSWIGNASGSATEDKTVKAGGYNGSQGNDSTGSGNVVQTPVALPAEILGVGGSWIGQGQGTASETKVITAGGGGNTQDDHGAGSANLVAVPVSAPVQAFGIGGSWIGQGHGTASTDTTSKAGDKLNANGKEGFLAGNLGAVPVSLPTQVHGIGGSWIGNGFGESQNMTDSTAGGNATATGQGGSVAGNIIQAPLAGAASVFGIGGVWGGVVGGDATNDVVSTAGGTAETNGDGGSIAGDVVSPQLMPVAQVFGDAASLTGVAHGSGINSTETTSGGDITTSGVGGALSGDIFDVPAAAVAQVFGVAASLGGVAHAVADNTTTGTVGGTDTTSPTAASSLAGISKQVPLGAVVQVFHLPLGLLAAVSSTTTNATDISVAGHEPQINLPISLPEMAATGLPSLPGAKTLPVAQRADVPGLPVQLPGTDGLPSLPSLPELPAAGLPSVPGLPAAGLPSLPELPAAGLPSLPAAGLPSLPSLPAAGLPSLPGLPSVPGLPAEATNPQNLLPQAELPAIANLDSNPAAAFDKVTGLVSGKGISIQG